MTEFKKLTAAVAELHDLSASLETACQQSAGNQEGNSSLLEAVHGMKVSLFLSLHALYPRIVKILLKARETDPNRQIYNEKMCERIEQLYTSFCDGPLRLWHLPVGSVKTENAGCLYHRQTEDEEASCSFWSDLQLRYQAGQSGEQGATDGEEEAVVVSPPNDAEEASSGERKKPSEMELMEWVLLEDGEEAFAQLEAMPFFSRLTTAYHIHVCEQAAAEAWKNQVLSALSDVPVLEESLRKVVIAEQHVAFKQLTEMKRADKLNLILKEENAKAERWVAEMARRTDEHRQLVELSQDWLQKGILWEILKGDFSANPFDCGQQHPLTGSPSLEDAKNEEELQLPSSVLHCVRHLSLLVQCLSKNPSDEGIRFIRSNHPACMEHYGHPCYLSIRRGVRDEESSSTEVVPCACQWTLHFTECVLYMMGYQVHYETWEEVLEKSYPHHSTKASGRMARQACSSSFVNQSALEPIPVPDFTFPCGSPASQHVFKAKGWEPYGERSYHLMEPNPMEDPDAWMAWFEFLKKLGTELEPFR